jgi:hypothetical protein
VIGHATTQDKTDDIKDRFYEEPERVFDKFPKYHTNFLLDMKHVFNPTTSSVL